MTWPDFYPADCPPEDSQPTIGIFYRFTETEVPTPDDFKSFRELDRTKEYNNLPEWQVCGLSVFIDRKEAIRAGARIPGLRQKHATFGSLTPVYGLYRKTPNKKNPEHHTWWHPLECTPWLIFEHDIEATHEIRMMGES